MSNFTGNDIFSQLEQIALTARELAKYVLHYKDVKPPYKVDDPIDLEVEQPAHPDKSLEYLQNIADGVNKWTPTPQSQSQAQTSPTSPQPSITTQGSAPKIPSWPTTSMKDQIYEIIEIIECLSRYISALEHCFSNDDKVIENENDDITKVISNNNADYKVIDDALRRESWADYLILLKDWGEIHKPLLSDHSVDKYLRGKDKGRRDERVKAIGEFKKKMRDAIRRQLDICHQVDNQW